VVFVAIEEIEVEGLIAPYAEPDWLSDTERIFDWFEGHIKVPRRGFTSVVIPARFVGHYPNGFGLIPGRALHFDRRTLYLGGQ
jgi:hypothetical protein